MKSMMSVLLGTLLFISLTSCSAGPNAVGQHKPKTLAGSTAPPAEISFFSNNPDRKSGQGKVEQDLIDQYMQLHPEIRIKVITMAPDSQFQDKIKLYNNNNNLPDIFMMWRDSSYMQPLVNNHALAPIDMEKLQGDHFASDSFQPYSFDGRQYGIPKNSDFWVIYYNKQIFQDNGLTVPTTDEELFADCKILKAKGIIPIAIDGRDAYPFNLWWEVMVERFSGTNETLHDALLRKTSYQLPDIVNAAKEMQKWIKAGVFGDGFLDKDYGAARNLFGQGKAAMLMQGDWEGGMADDQNLPESVRKSMGAFNFPAVTGGKGTRNDLISWYGSAWGISSRSKHVKEAEAFLDWCFKPEHWPTRVLQSGAAFPAQTVPLSSIGPIQNNLGSSLLEIYKNANPNAPYVYTPEMTPDGFTSMNNLMLQLVSLKITPDEFVTRMDNIADQSWKEQH